MRASDCPQTELIESINAPLVPAPAVDDQTGRRCESRAVSAGLEARKAAGGGSRGTVLFIASRFPPVASVGAIRAGKFVKYLGRFGWQPVVMTAAMPRGSGTDHSVGRARDATGLADLPAGLPVFRWSATSEGWPERWSDALGAWIAAAAGPFGRDARSYRDGLRWRFQRVHDRCALPDAGVWNLPSAVKLAARLHRRYRFDAIFSTGMPFSDHLIGLAVRRLLRRPWLADFRDPWVEYIHWPQWQSARGRRCTRAMEAAVIRGAARVISVNGSMTRRFMVRYRDEPASKFVTIPNGFDPADFGSARSRQANARFHLLYAGSLYGARSPDKLLEAFRIFLKTVPGSATHVRFDFMGRPGPHLEKLAGSEYAGTVRYLGLCSHAAALQAVASADLNVVLLPDVPGSENDTTTKIYECLGSGRPILAAVPLDGAAARVLRPFDGVSLCAPDDVRGMVDAIKDWYGRWLSGDVEVSRPAEDLAPLTRQYQTGRLAACLSAVAARRIAGGRVR